MNKGFDIEKIYHPCHFCGDSVDQEGYGIKGDRHFISDCRPDLVEHEPGDVCTWSYSVIENLRCYAYQDPDTKEWTKEHKFFSKDGPM